MNKFVLRAAMMAHQIQRWHMVGQYQRQDIAQHSFRVAFISAHIADIARRSGMEGVSGEQAFLLGAMHDLGETVTGDIPSHVKAAIKAAGIDVDILAEREGHYDTPEPYKWIVKGADMMEAALFVKYDNEQTDSRGQQVKQAIITALINYMHSFGETVQFGALKQAWDDIEYTQHSLFDYNLAFPEQDSDGE